MEEDGALVIGLLGQMRQGLADRGLGRLAVQQQAHLVRRVVAAVGIDQQIADILRVLEHRRWEPVCW